MSEIKLEAGQWYKLLDERIGFCIGEGPKNGDIHYDNYPMLLVFNYAGNVYGWYTADGVSADESDDNVVEHLPGCTGFDWVPTPKLQLREGAWYVRKDGEIVGPCVKESRDSCGHAWSIFPYLYFDDGKNNASTEVHLIREVEPPQPKYRPFANLKEFYPHHTRLVCVNVPNPRVLELYRVQVFNDHTFWLHTETGKSYASGLLDYQFADYVDGKIVFSPFGVIDQ
jgi:hypothetical protein